MTGNTGTTESEPSVAYPPPFQSLKRWTAASIILIVSVGGLWLTWAHHAQELLQSRLDAIVAKHEPLRPSDFQQPKIPDEQNAVYYWLAAAKAVDTSAQGPSNSGVARTDLYPPPPAWIRFVNKAAARNTKAFALARHAANCPQVDWGPSLHPGGKSVDLNPLGIFYMLNNLLYDVAANSHLHGDDAQAIEFIRESFRISAATYDCPYIVGQVMADDSELMPLAELFYIVPDLLIQPNATATASVHPASRHLVVALTKMLMDEQAHVPQAQAAVFGSRIASFEQQRQWISRTTLLRPLLQIDATYDLDRSNEELTAMSKQSYPAASAAMFPHISNIVSDTSSAFYDGTAYLLRDRWRNIAGCRVAAVDLAICLYRRDYNQWPPNLEALVPNYLSQIPRDPFSTTNAPIGYTILVRPGTQNTPRPMLYCDFSGQPGANPPIDRPTFFDHTRGAGRMWLDLSRWSPPIPQQPSTR